LEIKWLRAGRRTRIAQTNHIARDNPAAVVRVDEEVERQIRQLRDHPLIGRPGREPGTLELVISRTPFIASYRITKSRVEILRILHGAQQWPTELGHSE